jgi:hypothetical protein
MNIKVCTTHHSTIPFSNTIGKLINKTWDYSRFLTPEPEAGKGTAELSAGM